MERIGAIFSMGLGVDALHVALVKLKWLLSDLDITLDTFLAISCTLPLYIRDHNTIHLAYLYLRQTTLPLAYLPINGYLHLTLLPSMLCLVWIKSSFHR